MRSQITAKSIISFVIILVYGLECMHESCISKYQALFLLFITKSDCYNLGVVTCKFVMFEEWTQIRSLQAILPDLWNAEPNLIFFFLAHESTAIVVGFRHTILRTVRIRSSAFPGIIRLYHTLNQNLLPFRPLRHSTFKHSFKTSMHFNSTTFRLHKIQKCWDLSSCKL